MSQESFARALGVSRSAYQHYEREERDAPASLLANVCGLFGVSPIWLLMDDGSAEAAKVRREHFVAAESLGDLIADRASIRDKMLTRGETQRIIAHLSREFFNPIKGVVVVPDEAIAKVDAAIDLVVG